MVVDIVAVDTVDMVAVDTVGKAVADTVGKVAGGMVDTPVGGMLLVVGGIQRVVGDSPGVACKVEEGELGGILQVVRGKVKTHLKI